MSEIFEGLICQAPVPALQAIIADLGVPLDLAVYALSDQASVIYQSGSRGSSAFTEEADRLAADVSLRFGKVLLVRYDSRVGHRSSYLYANGQLVKAFQEHDELFVPLDDRGQPITGATPLRFPELVAGEEYETIQNAIELGLTELGNTSWVELKHLIARA